MSAPPTVEGQLERVVAEHVRARESGILTIAEGKIRRLFCLRKGRLIHVASNIIEEQFEEYLVRENHITLAQRAKSTLESKREGVPALQWLQDNECIGADELESAIESHAGDLLALALNAPKSAESAFQRGTPNLEGKPTADIDMSILLFDILGKFPKSIHQVRIRVGKPGMHPVQVGEQARRVEPLLAARPLAKEVWEHSAGSLKVSQLVERVPGGEEAALRALYALVLLGVVEAVAAPKPTAKTAVDAPVTKIEVETRVDRALDANHYGVLELMPDATTDEIRDSYYLLARRYHPDRFRSGDLTDLLARVEYYFAQVTEAYNTLTDTALRAQYDEELALKDSKTGVDEPEHDGGYIARQNFMRARALIQRNQYQQAVQFLENALELEENSPEYNVELGRVLTRNPRRRDEAERYLRRGLELDPTAIEGHVALADLFVKRDRSDDAIRVLTEALNWHPGHVELTRRLEELGVGKGRGLFGR